MFDTLEKVIDVKDTQVDRAKDYLSDTLPRTKLVLGEALNLCDEIKALELRHHQSVVITTANIFMCIKYIYQILTETTKVAHLQHPLFYTTLKQC